MILAVNTTLEYFCAPQHIVFATKIKNCRIETIFRTFHLRYWPRTNSRILQIDDIDDRMRNHIFLGYKCVDFAVNTIEGMILMLDLYVIKHWRDVSFGTYRRQKYSIQISQQSIIIFGNAPQNPVCCRRSLGRSSARRRWRSRSHRPTTNLLFHQTTPTIQWSSIAMLCYVIRPLFYIELSILLF